jgi:uncharacterized protein YcbX
MPSISAIYLYPVKACAGILLQTAELDHRGLKYDRQWMVVDPQGGFLSQRTVPQLALIQTSFSQDREYLILTLPGEPPLWIGPMTEGEKCQVTVWGDRCQAFDVGDKVAAELSQFLKLPCRLVQMDPQWIRPVDPKFAPNSHSQTGFSDGFPLLGISEASLADLNHRLLSPLPMNRFRPNLVFTETDPYAEDRWHTISIGSIPFRGVKRCARCKVTTVDQATGEFTGQEPLRTLATYRQLARGIIFGQNFVHLQSGVIQVGDPVHISLEADVP